MTARSAGPRRRGTARRRRAGDTRRAARAREAPRRRGRPRAPEARARPRARPRRRRLLQRSRGCRSPAWSPPSIASTFSRQPAAVIAHRPQDGCGKCARRGRAGLFFRRLARYGLGRGTTRRSARQHGPARRDPRWDRARGDGAGPGRRAPLRERRGGAPLWARVERRAARPLRRRGARPVRDRGRGRGSAAPGAAAEPARPRHGRDPRGRRRLPAEAQWRGALVRSLLEAAAVRDRRRRARRQRLPGRHGRAQCRGSYPLPRRGQLDPLCSARRRGDARGAGGAAGSAAGRLLHRRPARRGREPAADRDRPPEPGARSAAARAAPAVSPRVQPRPSRLARDRERRAPPHSRRTRWRARRGGRGRGAHADVRNTRGALVHRRPPRDPRQAARDDLTRHGRVAPPVWHLRSRARDRHRCEGGTRDRQRAAARRGAAILRPARHAARLGPRRDRVLGSGAALHPRQRRAGGDQPALCGGARRTHPRRGDPAPRAAARASLPPGARVRRADRAHRVDRRRRRADRGQAPLAFELLPRAGAGGRRRDRGRRRDHGDHRPQARRRPPPPARRGRRALLLVARPRGDLPPDRPRRRAAHRRRLQHLPCRRRQPAARGSRPRRPGARAADAHDAGQLCGAGGDAAADAARRRRGRAAPLPDRHPGARRRARADRARPEGFPACGLALDDVRPVRLTRRDPRRDDPRLTGAGQVRGKRPRPRARARAIARQPPSTTPGSSASCASARRCSSRSRRPPSTASWSSRPRGGCSRTTAASPSCGASRTS